MNSYINMAIPFGAYVSSSLQIAKTTLRYPFQEKPTNQHQPAWKPFLYKGKQQISFIFREEVNCAQYDSKEKQDVWDVSGSVHCKVKKKIFSFFIFFLFFIFNLSK